RDRRVEDVCSRHGLRVCCPLLLPIADCLLTSPLAGDDVILHAAAAQQRALRGYAADVDARPADLAGKAAVLDLRAAVHDNQKARGLGLRRGLVAAHAELHPHDLDAELVLETARLARVRGGSRRPA